MKIVQIIDTLNIGGAERMCVNISNLLTAKSVENSIIVTRKLGPLSNQVGADKIDVLSKKHGFDLIAFYQFFKIIKNKQPDVLHAHSTSIYWAVLVKLIFPRLKLIWHDHDGMSEYLKESDRKIIKVISMFFHSVIAVNHILLNWNLRNLKLNKIYYLRNFSLFNHNLNRVKNTKPKIVCLANFREQKDHMTLFKALALIPDQIKFECICAGQISDLNYFNNLKSYCDENLGDKVIFAGEVTDVENLLLTADIGVLSSKSEGLPVALLEYGLAGLPVVVTDVGQCAEVIGNGEFGELVEIEDYDRMAKKILKLIENEDYRLQLGNKYKSHIESEFGGELFYQDYIKIVA